MRAIARGADLLTGGFNYDTKVSVDTKAAGTVREAREREARRRRRDARRATHGGRRRREGVRARGRKREGESAGGRTVGNIFGVVEGCASARFARLTFGMGVFFDFAGRVRLRRSKGRGGER